MSIPPLLESACTSPAWLITRIEPFDVSKAASPDVSCSAILPLLVSTCTPLGAGASILNEHPSPDCGLPSGHSTRTFSVPPAASATTFVSSSRCCVRARTVATTTASDPSPACTSTFPFRVRTSTPVPAFTGTRTVRVSLYCGLLE